MRSDMSKVVIDTARRGGSNRFHQPRRRGDELEHYPTQQSMRRIHKDTKSLSDRLSPLRRYLGKQVGRPWNSVWSDISASMDFRSVLGFHIKTHIREYVSQHVMMKGGKPYRSNSKWGPDWVRPGELYVHPSNGLLCRMPAPKAKPEHKKEQTKVRLPDGTRLAKLHGIWYEAEYGLRQEPKMRFNSAYKRWEPESDENRPMVFDRMIDVEYIKAKRQLSKRELKDFGLRNTQPLDRSS